MVRRIGGQNLEAAGSAPGCANARVLVRGGAQMGWVVMSSRCWRSQRRPWPGEAAVFTGWGHERAAARSSGRGRRSGWRGWRRALHRATCHEPVLDVQVDGFVRDPHADHVRVASNRETSRCGSEHGDDGLRDRCSAAYKTCAESVPRSFGKITYLRRQRCNATPGRWKRQGSRCLSRADLPRLSGR
jgi:hypothetical protein